MVSVVMPIHNTGEYLRESLNCLINQTIQDYEIICVDDCSTDKITIDILNKYKNDRRLRYIKLNKNLGAAEARNIGLSMARGEYVIFLDSDDLFSENYLKKMYDEAVDNDLDICICSIAKYNGLNTEYYERPAEISDYVFQMDDLDEGGFFYCWLAAWNKLIKREFIINNNILFQSLSSSNDVLFSCIALQRANRIKYLRQKGMVIWRVNRKGQISAHRDPNNLIAVVDAFLTMISDNDVLAKRKIMEVLLRNGVGEIESSDDDNKNRLFYNNLNDYISGHPQLYDTLTIKQKLMARCYRIFSIDSLWWREDRLFYSQLLINWENLEKKIDKKNRIVLWGIGRRGKAFLQLCKEKGRIIWGIFDQNKKAYERVDDYIFFEDIYEVLKSADSIIASNKEIYSKAKAMADVDVCLIDLQEYAPVV